MGNVTINHWKIIQAMLERGEKPNIGLIETALEQKEPMPVEMNDFILRVLRGEKGLLVYSVAAQRNLDGTSKHVSIDILLKIIKQEYGELSATEFKANAAEEKGISERTLDSQVKRVKSFFGLNKPR